MLSGKCQPTLRQRFEGTCRGVHKSCHKQAAHLIRCKRVRQQDDTIDPTRQQQLLQLVAAVAVGSIAFCPPSLAELQTVAAEQATSLAKPIKSQPVKKGRVWGLFLIGATGLFGGALALEKNAKFFPAISKANQAIAATRAAQKKRAKEEEDAAKQEAIEVKSEEAVLQGLMDARDNVLSPSTSGQEDASQPSNGKESQVSSQPHSSSANSNVPAKDDSVVSEKKGQLANAETEIDVRKSSQEQQKIAQ